MQDSMRLTTPVGLGLRQWLLVDAITCLLAGSLLASAPGFLAPAFGLPEGLLRYAGLVLFPCAALMFTAARTEAKALVWTVILGNFAWAGASVIVAFAFEPTILGLVFTLAQAAVVALLGFLELRARQPRS
jgi:hypothetical protein